jgi:hypothetical protein
VRVPKIRWEHVVFAILAAAAVWIRLNFYEPLERSVSNYDTERYTHSGEASVFSLDFYTSIRQPTTALAYQLVETPDGYEVTNISSPGDQIHPPLQVQPGFDRITALQSWLAIGAWLLLAGVVFRNLRHPVFKLVGAATILVFAFTPQIAEWDYVMLSEPISLSLFAALLAISIELVASFASKEPQRKGKIVFLVATWFAVVALWAFARDTNAYMLPLFALALIGLALWRPTSDRIGRRNLLIAAAALVLLFLAVARTAQLSERWVNPYFNNILARVLPVPEHRAFFEARGLPVSEELLAEVGGNLTELSLFEDDALVEWVQDKGLSTYIEFLVTHPAWALGEFVNGIAIGFSENAQPFFRRSETTPEALVYWGNLLHPQDAGVIFVVVGEMVIVGVVATRSSRMRAIGLLFGILLIGDFATLFMAIHGDASSIVRHVVGSIMPLRLTLWLLAPFTLDGIAVTRGSK